MAEFEVYRIRFKCADGIQFEFCQPCVDSIQEVRASCSRFANILLPSVFWPCSYDVKIDVSDIDPCEDGNFFYVRAFQALCRSLRTPYLFNSKFYRYALKSKEKRASQA